MRFCEGSCLFEASIQESKNEILGFALQSKEIERHLTGFPGFSVVKFHFKAHINNKCHGITYVP